MRSERWSSGTREKILDCTKDAVWGVSSGSGMRQRAAVMNSVKATNARRPRRANRKSRAMATATTTETGEVLPGAGAHHISLWYELRGFQTTSKEYHSEFDRFDLEKTVW